MKFKFFIPSDEIIPIKMRLIADDGRQIEYAKYPGLNFIFKYDNSWSEAEALEATRTIAYSMVWQSDDHSSRWIIQKMERVDNEPTTGRQRFHVSFRIRDSY